MFGEILKNLIESRKITHEHLAKELGLERSTISKYVAGKHEPSILVIKKLAEFFEISIDQLLGSEIEYAINEGSTLDKDKILDILDELESCIDDTSCKIKKLKGNL